MGRETCSMYDTIGNTVYCSYFDYGCFSCQSLTNCPDGLDDDEDEECYEDDDEVGSYTLVKGA